MDREIALSKGMIALVSEEDFEWFSQFKWHVVWEKCTQSYYAEAWLYSPLRVREVMHRMVMGCKKRDGKLVDHINGNTLDNRRENLRIVNHSQNAMNRKLESVNTSSGHRGVTFCKQTGKWAAKISTQDRNIWLGRYSSRELAIAAVKQGLVDNFGEYARTQ